MSPMLSDILRGLLARGDELLVLLAGAGVAAPFATCRLALPAIPPWLSPLAMPAPLRLPDASQDRDGPGRFRAAQLLGHRRDPSA